MISMTWPQYLRQECRVCDWIVALTRRETEILLLLLMRYPNPVPMEDIISFVWPEPDLEPDIAAESVHRSLHNLRAMVGRQRIVHRQGFGFELKKEKKYAGGKLEVACRAAAS